MAFINPCHRGLAYGDGYMESAGELGQVVKIVGSDLFAVNTDPTKKSFGLLIKSYAKNQMPGIYCMGGVYETDVFEGIERVTIVALDREFNQRFELPNVRREHKRHMAEVFVEGVGFGVNRNRQTRDYCR